MKIKYLINILESLDDDAQNIRSPGGKIYKEYTWLKMETDIPFTPTPGLKITGLARVSLLVQEILRFDYVRQEIVVLLAPDPNDRGDKLRFSDLPQNPIDYWECSN